MIQGSDVRGNNVEQLDEALYSSLEDLYKGAEPRKVIDCVLERLNVALCVVVFYFISHEGYSLGDSGKTFSPWKHLSPFRYPRRPPRTLPPRCNSVARAHRSALLGRRLRG